jgi:hypothetical protein
MSLSTLGVSWNSNRLQAPRKCGGCRRGEVKGLHKVSIESKGFMEVWAEGCH